MSNAYFSNSDSLTVGSNINGPQVLFEYAGRQIQIPIPPGMDPIVAVNNYIAALRGGFGGGDPNRIDDLQGTENPDNLVNIEPSSNDDSPLDMTELDAVSVVPENDAAYNGSIGNNFASGWNVDGVNTIKGYQPYSTIPVLTAPETPGFQIPSLEGFFQGTIELPRLRIRRKEFAGTGLLRGQ